MTQKLLNDFSFAVQGVNSRADLCIGRELVYRSFLPFLFTKKKGIWINNLAHLIYIRKIEDTVGEINK